MKIDYKNRSYTWNGSGWLDHYGLQVADSLNAQLNRKFLDGWWTNTASRPDHESLPLVEKMARQYLRLYPREPVVMAMLGAALRNQRQARPERPICPPGFSVRPRQLD